MIDHGGSFTPTGGSVKSTERGNGYPSFEGQVGMELPDAVPSLRSFINPTEFYYQGHNSKTG